jgi:hypothetical protein
MSVISLSSAGLSCPILFGQGVFLRLDLAGSSNLVLACRQIELLIVLVDLLEIILGRLQVVLGSLPMTDRGPHRSIAGRSLDLRLRSVQPPLTPTA